MCIIYNIMYIIIFYIIYNTYIINICIYIQISYGLKFSYRNKASSSHVYFFISYMCININKYVWPQVLGFPGGSEGKESACSAGGRSSIPRSGRFPGEGIGYPRQYSWASLVAQMIKKLPATREAWVQSLGWEDPLEKRSYPLQYSCLENSMDRGAWWATVHGVTKSRTQLSNFHSLHGHR